MKSNHATEIENWFAQCDVNGDLEFVRWPNDSQITVIEPIDTSTALLYATKPAVAALAFNESQCRAQLGLIGRYGLPNETDVNRILHNIGDSKVYFLGDMDPVDLLIFAWLRERLAGVLVEYTGVGDAYLAALEIELPDSFEITFATSERAAMSLLNKVFPDLNEIVGPKCADLLQHGRKIEIEAAVTAMGTAARLLDPVSRI